MTQALAVFDLGKTNAKLVLFSPTGETLAERRTHRAPVVVAGSRCLDAEGIEAWLRATLEELSRDFLLTGVMIATHGCAFALIRDGRLAAPILDYEQEMPDEAEAAFRPHVPAFAETFSPDLPGGLNYARHIFLREWQSPGLVASADHILSYPQYWVWRLTGALASEVSFLGCHSHLWNPLAGDFSSLVDGFGWRAKFPPLVPAGTVMGAVRIGGRDVPVHNGVHDSNAAFHFYRGLGLGSFTLVSTGTWVIVFNPGCPLSVLDASRDMLANVTVRGEPVATARFMGGREFDVISGAARVEAGPDAVARAVSAGLRALPSFAPGGPCPGRAGKVLGPVRTAAERTAVATLYVALMLDVTLDNLRSHGPIVLDGGLAQNGALLGLVAALREGQTLSATGNSEGTAMGAAALAFEAAGRPVPFRAVLSPVAPRAPAGLAGYRDRWRSEAGAS